MILKAPPGNAAGSATTSETARVRPRAAGYRHREATQGVQALRIWIQQYYRDGEKVIRREERVHGLDQLGVGDGTRLLDIAYGSGFAAQLAARRGAVVTGIDASDALVKIAGARTAEGDFRVGDMFALPFPGASFDVATSFNGIWKGCEAALREAARGAGARRPARPDLLGPPRACRPHAVLPQDHRAVTAQPR